MYFYKQKVDFENHLDIKIKLFIKNQKVHIIIVSFFLPVFLNFILLNILVLKYKRQRHLLIFKSYNQ